MRDETRVDAHCENVGEHHQHPEDTVAEVINKRTL